MNEKHLEAVELFDRLGNKTVVSINPVTGATGDGYCVTRTLVQNAERDGVHRWLTAATKSKAFSADVKMMMGEHPNTGTSKGEPVRRPRQRVKSAGFRALAGSPLSA